MTKKNAVKVATRARQATHGGSYAAHRRVVAGPGAPSSKPWTCSKCGRAIESGAGYVLVMDAATHDYPQRATSTHVTLTAQAVEERRKRGAPTEPPYGFLGVNEIEIMPDQIAFDALHRACDPNPNANPYSIDVEHASSLEAWCGWVHHLVEKRWMGKPDLGNMIEFWFSNRGEDIHRQVGR